jgi:hypothetical protein
MTAAFFAELKLRGRPSTLKSVANYLKSPANDESKRRANRRAE